MPLLDHFHPPLHGPRRWEGFHHMWAASVASQLNQQLPANYYAESEITVGPEMEIDVASLELPGRAVAPSATSTAVWTPPKAALSVKVDYSHLEGYEVLVYADEGGATLRGAVELLSPANKDREGTRRTFAAKCAGYVRRGVGVVIVDVVTNRSGNLHAELFELLEVRSRRPVWESPTGLYAVAYRPVTLRKNPRLEVWTETLELGESLPTLPLWLNLELCIPIKLEETYTAACRSLRLPA